jgi:predicted small secreted protein
MKKTFRFLAVLAVLLLTLSLSACATLKDVNKSSETFMQALKDQDNATSWSLLSEGLKKEIGSEDAWAEFTAPRAFETWKFTSTSFSDNSGEAEGTAEINGETYDLYFGLVKENSAWLIEAIEFKFVE